LSIFFSLKRMNW